MIYVNIAPIIWYSKHHNTVEVSSFGQGLLRLVSRQRWLSICGTSEMVLQRYFWKKVSCQELNYTYISGFHHLIHKTKQGVHKGTNMDEIYSRLGWILTSIYFPPLLLPSTVKIFEAPATLPLSFVAAPKTNYGTGGNTGLLKSWVTLKLVWFALAGRCCSRRGHDSPKKWAFPLPYFFSLFLLPLKMYFLVSSGRLLNPWAI